MSPIDSLAEWYKAKAPRSLPRYHAIEVYDTPPATKLLERLLPWLGVIVIAVVLLFAFMGAPL